MSNVINYQPWLQAILVIAKQYLLEPSEERIRLQLDWAQHQTVEDVLSLTTRQIGLHYRKCGLSLNEISPWHLPVLIEMQDGQVGVLDKIDANGNLSVQLSGDQGLAQVFTFETLKPHVANIYVLRPEKSVPDVRVDEYVKPYDPSWFWSIVLRDWKRYLDIMLASLMANILALATIVFP